ncbi:hypothetical protein GW17_00055747 [Ensete ventricosum]|nr:hypothetical protein GW17_00055747 [Ensete ventricosum]
MVSQKNAMVIYFPRIARRVEFRSYFCVPSQKFKIVAFPDVLAHGKSYEHGFTKKYDGHKLCVKLRADSSFYRFFVHRLGNSKYHFGNSKYWPFPTVEFQSVFRALSWKFKILAIPDVLDLGKSYEHGFTKKHNVHKLSRSCEQSQVSIDFLCTVLEIQNTGQSQRISP